MNRFLVQYKCVHCSEVFSAESEAIDEAKDCPECKTLTEPKHELDGIHVQSLHADDLVEIDLAVDLNVSVKEILLFLQSLGCPPGTASQAILHSQYLRIRLEWPNLEKPTYQRRSH